MIMYYLAKFCRICIQTEGKLMDIEALDYDSVKFSEKLRVCTQMVNKILFLLMTAYHIDFLSQVITRESISTQICSSCVNKLRVSYQFHNMCKKSTTILQKYLTELLSMSDDLAPEKFELSELHINISTAPPKPRRRKRVGKDERCSLLKKLLSKITHEQFLHNIHINGLTKLCDNIPLVADHKQTHQPSINKSSTETIIRNKPKTGGLKNLLNFTKSYDFGYDISNKSTCYKNVDLTPLEKLAKFTENFFYDHFLDYRETILYMNDTLDSDSDEDMFELLDEYTEVNVKEEIVIVEPDVTIKKELFCDEIETCYAEEAQEEPLVDYQFSSNFVQVCYDNLDIKKEIDERLLNSASDTIHTSNTQMSASSSYMQPNVSVASNLVPHCLLTNSDLIKQLQVPLGHIYRKPRTLSPYSVKCRTRGNPFINPQLKKQFQNRNFKCAVCNRRFKSLGYLKAHCSKLKH